MPELPDLQVFSRNLTKALKGKHLKSITVVNDRKLNVKEPELKAALEGLKLEKVQRVGKELHFLFEKGQVLGLHLMLNGVFHLYQDKNDQKYTIIELLFDDGTGLAMTDFQSAATPTLNPEANNTPDALSDDANFAYFKEKLSKKRTPIKTVLLDQHIVRGIGNAYADEILWDARLSPFSIANKIPDEKIKVLIKSVKKILEDAEQQILKVKPDLISGEVRDFMEVHNARKKQTSTGATIHQQPISSRKTYYTDEQELFN